MALVKGTNCGFVTVAPTADPDGQSAEGGMDTLAQGLKDTSPNYISTITEIGWYASNDSQTSNYAVAIYAQNVGDDEPEEILVSSATNEKGTTEGWYTTNVNLKIEKNTIYWIAVQLDDTGTQTRIDKEDTVGERRAYKTSQTELTDPWGTSTGTGETLLAIYAKIKKVTETGGIGTRFIRTNYPNIEGLIAFTTKQTLNPILEPTEKGTF